MVISNSSSSFTSFISIALISTQVEYEQLHATLPLLELQAEDGATREELEMSLDNLMEVNCFKQFLNTLRAVGEGAETETTRLVKRLEQRIRQLEIQATRPGPGGELDLLKRLERHLGQTTDRMNDAVNANRDDRDQIHEGMLQGHASGRKSTIF